MIPRKNGIEAEGIPSVTVETSESTIPRKPIFFEGGPAPEPIDLQSITITENGTTEAPEGVAYNEVIVDVDTPTPPTPTVYSPTYIKFQKYFREPEIGHICGPDESLIYTDWVYLESAGQVVVPPLPNDGIASKLVVSDVQYPAFDNIGNATVFYCFSDDNAAHARGSYPNEITYTQQHNQQVAPGKIYTYTPGGTFEWSEIIVDSARWNNKEYNNTIDHILYSSDDIIRNTVSSIVYYQLQNLIGEGGKISDPYKTDYYDVYYCKEGTQINSQDAVTVPAVVEYIGNMTLKGMYDLLSGGTFPPNE